MDARESSFLAFVRAHQAQLQREALQLTGEPRVATRLSREALVSAYRHWTPGLSVAAAEQLADRELGRQVRAWRRSGQAEMLAARVDDPAGVARYDPAPLDADAVLADAHRREGRRGRRRPILVAGLAVAVLALVAAYLLDRAAVDAVDEGLTGVNLSGRTNAALTTTSPPVTKVERVELTCGAGSPSGSGSSSGTSAAAETVWVEADLRGVPLTIPAGRSSAGISWSADDPREAPGTVGGEFGGIGHVGSRTHAPIPPGRWFVECYSASAEGFGQSLTIVEVADPAGAWQGDLEQAGCLAHSGLSRPGAFGATAAEAVDHLQLLAAPVLVELDTAGSSLVRAQAGYSGDELPTYLAVLGGNPVYAIEVRTVVGGVIASPVLRCVQPGEPIPDMPGAGQPGRRSPTGVDVSCETDQASANHDEAVASRGILIRSSDRGPTATMVRVAGQGVTEDRELTLAGHAVPVPPGMVSITCLSGPAQGTSTTVELVDPNGYWNGTAEQYGCLAQPLEVDAPTFDLGELGPDQLAALAPYGLPSYHNQPLGYSHRQEYFLEGDSQQILVESPDGRSRFIWRFDTTAGGLSGTPVARCD